MPYMIAVSLEMSDEPYFSVACRRYKDSRENIKKNGYRTSTSYKGENKRVCFIASIQVCFHSRKGLKSFSLQTFLCIKIHL